MPDPSAPPVIHVRGVHHESAALSGTGGLAQNRFRVRHLAEIGRAESVRTSDLELSDVPSICGRTANHDIVHDEAGTDARPQVDERVVGP